MKRVLAVVRVVLALLFSALPARAFNLPSSASVPVPLLDLNSATMAQLTDLPGIGDARARSILKCREARPLQAKDELVERCGGPKSVYEQVKGLVIARQAKR